MTTAASVRATHRAKAQKSWFRVAVAHRDHGDRGRRGSQGGDGQQPIPPEVPGLVTCVGDRRSTVAMPLSGPQRHRIRSGRPPPRPATAEAPASSVSQGRTPFEHCAWISTSSSAPGELDLDLRGPALGTDLVKPAPAFADTSAIGRPCSAPSPCRRRWPC